MISPDLRQTSILKDGVLLEGVIDYRFAEKDAVKEVYEFQNNTPVAVVKGKESYELTLKMYGGFPDFVIEGFNIEITDPYAHLQMSDCRVSEIEHERDGSGKIYTVVKIVSKRKCYG